jgi:dopamine beta-monooxygenase
MGADRFVYPSNAGGVLGGENYSPYLVLEVHYDNAHLKQNIIDSSGIRIYYENKLRTYDAGILEIGLEYNPKMVIPPQLKSFHLNGYCLGECTKASLKKPITLFASQLHTHLTGRRVWTSLIRHNEIVDIVNSDNHFDQMFQEIRLLPKPIQVRPGDALLTQCIYETMDRNSTTFGGYSIRDEMCVNYLHYYPLSDLEVCKSSISDDVLNTFFLKMKEYDLAQIDLKRKSIRENFDSIRWTPLTSSILNELYEIAPIAFSCNSSHGKHIRQAYKNNKNGVFDLIRLDDDNDMRILKQNYAPSIIDTKGYCDYNL